jgi:Flp pilus assembly CpaF family ATPase
VRLEARPGLTDKNGLTIRDLLKNTLRMRPDRIIVGEVRGGEVFDLLQAMNTGHEGSMTSVHANTPGECLLRLENLYMLSGYDLPLKALRYQISTAIDFIIQARDTGYFDKNNNYKCGYHVILPYLILSIDDQHIIRYEMLKDMTDLFKRNMNMP